MLVSQRANLLQFEFEFIIIKSSLSVCQFNFWTIILVWMFNTVFNLPLQNYKISCANVQLNLSGCSNNLMRGVGPEKNFKKKFFLRKKKNRKKIWDFF